MPSVVARIRVKAEKVDEARKFFHELAEEVRTNEPGTLAYLPHQRRDDPACFIFYEKYDSDAALRTHSANLGKVGARFAALLDGAPEILVLEEI